MYFELIISRKENIEAVIYFSFKLPNKLRVFIRFLIITMEVLAEEGVSGALKIVCSGLNTLYNLITGKGKGK